MNLIDDANFESMRFGIANMMEDFNHCCGKAMEVSNNGYVCKECGHVNKICGTIIDCNEDSTSVLRKTVGNTTFNINMDSARVQKKCILDTLHANNNDFNGLKFPKNVLARCTQEFNMIQKIMIDIDPVNPLAGTKKYVTRGDNRAEILGTILYLICIEEGVPRSKKTIAKFMKVGTGISRGEDTLRNLYNMGKITLNVDKCAWEAYLTRYMESLRLDKHVRRDDYKNFVLNLTADSILKHVATKSLITSKIVGALWILIIHEKLPITSKQLESSSDNIKKNTITTFSDEVEKNIVKFVDVFNRWKINLGLPQKLIKLGEFNDLVSAGKIRPFYRGMQTVTVVIEESPDTVPHLENAISDAICVDEHPYIIKDIKSKNKKARNFKR